jgi:tetrahydromethanopterin S-methyltransferase subunit B
MDNFNTNFNQPNNGNAIEQAERENRIQQLKIELIKTENPEQKAQIQALLDEEEKKQASSKTTNLIVGIIFGIIFIGFLIFIFSQFKNFGSSGV